MTARTVHLVRHATHGALGGRLCGRAPGFDLSREGRGQALAVARRLSAQGLEAVMTSPLERAWQTAEAIAEACAVPLQVDAGLLEIDFGDWTGAEFAALDDDPRWRRWNSDRGRTRPPRGESMAEAQARMARWLDGLCAPSAPSSVAAVSHADVIRAAVAHVLGLPLQFYDRFDISPASITTLRIDEDGPRLLTLNEIAHV